MEWGHLCLRYLSPSVTFCHGKVSADAPVKESILTLTTQALAICNGKTCSVGDLL